MKKLLILLAIFCPLLLAAQKNISAGKIKENIYYLASDSLKGRETGTEGQRMAAEYISEKFRRAGLVPAGNCKENPYLQRFSIYRPQKAYAFISPDTVVPSKRLKSTVFINDSLKTIYFDELSYRNGQHFLYISSSESFGERVKKIIRAEKINEKYSTQDSPAVLIEAKDLKGLPILVEKLYKENGISTFLVKLSGKRLENVLVDFPEDRFLYGKENGKMSFFNLGMLRPRKSKFPAEIFSIDAFCRNNPGCEVIIAGSQVINAIFPDEKTINSVFRYSAYTNGLWDSVVTENVAGLLEGKSREVIVTGAHYDHVGARGTNIFYGADDNASGTSAVIEIANEMCQNAKEGKLPEKSLIFVAFTAEEEGLIGSEAFMLNFPYDDRNVDMMVNMDMIGRNDKRNDTLTHYVYCLALGGRKMRTARTVRNASEEVLQTEIARKPDVVNRLLYRFGSDHHGFVRRGIPSVVFFTGLHDDYHKTTDTPDKIWISNCTQIAKVVCRSLYIFAGEKK